MSHFQNFSLFWIWISFLFVLFVFVFGFFYIITIKMKYFQEMLTLIILFSRSWLKWHMALKNTAGFLLSKGCFIMPFMYLHNTKEQQLVTSP